MIVSSEKPVGSRGRFFFIPDEPPVAMYNEWPSLLDGHEIQTLPYQTHLQASRKVAIVGKNITTNRTVNYFFVYPTFFIIHDYKEDFMMFRCIWLVHVLLGNSVKKHLMFNRRQKRKLQNTCVSLWYYM